MKVGSKWFTTAMGLYILLCTVAIALAAERIGYTVTGEGRGRKTGDAVAAPQSGAPDERLRTPNTVAGVRGQSPAEASDVIDEQDPLAPDPGISSPVFPLRSRFFGELIAPK